MIIDSCRTPPKVWHASRRVEGLDSNISDKLGDLSKLARRSRQSERNRSTLEDWIRLCEYRPDLMIALCPRRDLAPDFESSRAFRLCKVGLYSFDFGEGVVNLRFQAL